MSAAAPLADAHHHLVREVAYWERDFAAIEQGLAALDRLQILVEHASLSEEAYESAITWIEHSRSALQRFRRR